MADNYLEKKMEEYERKKLLMKKKGKLPKNKLSKKTNNEPKDGER